MSMMQAIHINEEDRSLSWLPTSRPEPAPHEVVLEVGATAVNRADLVQRSGKYPPPAGASPILGLEAAGRVAAVGEQVEGVELGDRACVLLTGGGYAEYVATPASLLMPIPRDFTMEQAAALPEVFFTAWVNLYMEAKLERGETALIHAAASGVGTAAIQLCNQFGQHVIAAASGEKLEFLRELGVQRALDRKSEDFVEVVKQQTHGRGVDMILDPVGGDYLERNLKSLATKGRLVHIGLMGGRSAEVNLGLLLVKRLRMMGSVLRGRSLEEKEEIAGQLRERVWPLFSSGELRPVIQETMGIEQAQQAHELIASNTTIGKVVLKVGEF